MRAGWLRGLAVISFGGFVSTLSPASAATVYEHRLQVAANPSIPITDEDVDDFIREANRLLHGRSASLGWDTACDDVRFVKAGPLVKHPHIPPAGKYSAIRSNAATFAPTANVIIVNAVDCTGDAILRVGCSLPGDVMVVGTQSGVEALLWVHERGHGVGLPHSAEPPATASSVGAERGMRIMFWQLARDRIGKRAEECRALEGTGLPSVAQADAGPGFAGELNLSAAFGADSIGAVSDSGPGASPPPPVQVPAQEGQESVLTPNAESVIAPPWEGVPVDAIQAFTPADVESVRELLRGAPSPFWAQAVTALALTGTAEDHAIINEPLSEAVPPADADKAGRAVGRDLLRAKLAVPVALGILASRTRSEEPVSTLDSLKEMDSAIEVMGLDSAIQFRFEALKGLAVADTLRASSILRSEIRSATSSSAISRLDTLSILSRMKGKNVPWREEAPSAEAGLTREEERTILRLQFDLGRAGLQRTLSPH